MIHVSLRPKILSVFDPCQSAFAKNLADLRLQADVRSQHISSTRRLESTRSLEGWLRQWHFLHYPTASGASTNETP